MRMLILTLYIVYISLIYHLYTLYILVFGVLLQVQRTRSTGLGLKKKYSTREGPSSTRSSTRTTLPRALCHAPLPLPEACGG